MSKRLVISLAAVVLAVVAAAGVVHYAGKSDAAGLPAVGSVITAVKRPAAPDIAGTTLAGRHLSIASLRGAPVVINFWGSWCAPCQAEAPALAKVAADTAKLGVHFVGIDVQDTTSSGQGFEQQHHITYPSISDPDNLLAASFGKAAPGATPATYILDSRGRIAWAYFGQTTYNQLELAVVKVAQS